MSRSADLLSRVKKGLEDLHQKTVNSPEIFYSLFRAQQNIATRFDLIKTAITINTIDGQTEYDLVVQSGSAITAGSFVAGTLYQIISIGTTDYTLIGAASNNIGVVFTATGVGTGTGTVKKAHKHVKRIDSWKTPQDWVTIYWKTEQQFDEILMVQPSVSRPQYAIIRNDQLVFHGAPTADDESVVCQVFLHTPTLEPSGSIEPETPIGMDPSLEAYAIWDLLPIVHGMKAALWAAYEKIADDSYGKLAHNISQPIIPRCRW